MKIEQLNEIKDFKPTVLIYAKPGEGKTYSLGFLPGQTLVIDVDHTSHVLKRHPNAKNIKRIEIDITRPLEDMSDIIKAFRGELNIGLDLSKIDNICIDNISELEKAILAEYGTKSNNRGVPTQGDYQRYQYKIANLVRTLRGLDKTVVITAWEEIIEVIDQNGTKLSVMSPLIQRKVRDNVLGLCDIVAHLEKGKNNIRGFRLESTPNVIAKNQFDERKQCKVEELLGGKKK